MRAIGFMAICKLRMGLEEFVKFRQGAVVIGVMTLPMRFVLWVDTISKVASVIKYWKVLLCLP